MNFHVTNYGCTLAYYSRSRPFSSRRSSYRRRHRRPSVNHRSLDKRITKIELQLKLNQCEETTVQQSRVSLKQLHHRVERIEHHLKKQNQQAKVTLTPKHCLELLRPEANNWPVIGTFLDIPEEILDQIEADHPSNCHLCIRKVIKAWLKQVDPPPSWKNLAEAVHKLNPSLAKKILDTAVDDNGRD